jgi:deoxyribodipyrimidine photo-lyase
VKTVIHWFRCDFRLTDNAALHAACLAAEQVVPVFIFDPAILKAPDTGAPIVGFMLECLRELARDLDAAGAKLIFRHGAPLVEMERLLRDTGATALYFNRDYEPMARLRDEAVTRMARSLGVDVHSFKDGMVHEPDEIRKDDGTPYKVFTAYSRVWRAKGLGTVLPHARFPRPPRPVQPESLPLPTAAELGFKVEIPLPPAGEAEAQRLLGAFCAKEVTCYGTQRNLPAIEGTSRLSPHLRLGTVSPRQAVALATRAHAGDRDAQPHVDTFVSELIWRDFYRQILWHFPHVATSCFKEAYDDLAWENNERLFQAWCEGRTGYPIVDAGMRQLNTTGWMHNRVRMITAMFLTKDLLVSWQWGERYFMQKLLDADLASNNGGWQWSAGTGTDAQPYFRIFNPTSQAEKFDPEGRYIRRYVPEVDLLTYPPPIVSHAEQRLKTLAMFKRVP